MASRPTDDLAKWADAQLTNWAMWACGKLATELRDGRAGLQPVEDEARACEAALLDMQRERSKLYLAVMLRYRNRWCDDSCAAEMRCSVPTYRQLMQRAYAWLDGRMAAQRAA